MKTKPKTQHKVLNIEADAVQPVATPADLKVIVALAREMYTLHTEMEKLEEQLKTKVTRFNVLQMETLPQRMQAAGLKSFTLGNGYIIDIKPFISCSIPTTNAIADKKDSVEQEALQKRRDAAMAWLREHDAASLIKNKLQAEFGKGEDKAAKLFAESITKKGYAVVLEEAVNPQTLKAFLTEQLEKGVEVPVEPFGLFSGSKAAIKKTK